MRKKADEWTGYFGPYGGRYAPETLMSPLEELAAAYDKLKRKRSFQRRLRKLLRDYAGRPTPLYRADRLTDRLGGAQIYLKREDLLHTGAHKLNNSIGQVLLAEAMGKERVIAETGAGQHGVATATAAALLGLSVTIYMGTEDMARQRPNVDRMRLLGAEIREVDTGSRTRKDAIMKMFLDGLFQVYISIFGVDVVVTALDRIILAVLFCLPVQGHEPGDRRTTADPSAGGGA